MDKKQCVVCGFDKRVHSHHIIKRRIGGLNTEENLVLLCPNHHWIADFGTEKERRIILELITKVTGKTGKGISDNEKKHLDEKIKVLQEQFMGAFRKRRKWEFSEEEWEKHKCTWNYENDKKNLLGRGLNEIQCSLLHKKAEILILINKLEEELEKIKF